MVQAFIAVITVVVLVALSVRANRRFKDLSRLPMQWLTPSTVTWTAPRIVALSFTPVLAAVVLVFISILNASLTPKPGQGWLLTPIFIFVALIFIGSHVLHLALIEKTVRRRDR